MRSKLIVILGFLLFCLWLPAIAVADIMAEAKVCASRGPDDLRIAACNKVIRDGNLSAENKAGALAYRSVVYSNQGKFESALRDVTEALRLFPNHFIALTARCKLNTFKGEYSAALADCNRAHQINTNSADPLVFRASAYFFMNNYQASIADATRAINLRPTAAEPYRIRARAHIVLNQLDEARADIEKAISIEPASPGAYINEGLLLEKKGQFEQAIASFNKAVAIGPKSTEALSFRADLLSRLQRAEDARRDAQQVLALPAYSPLSREAQIRAAELLTRLNTTALPPSPRPASTAAPVAPAPQPVPAAGRRIALVIGNSDYVNAGTLKNPARDARLVAETMRRVGFSEVRELYNLTQPQMVAALKDFGDRASSADWAVIYYAGHGMEMAGVAYLLPTDVKLEKDTHVQDETISLDRVLEKVEGARGLRLVILDACRNNPFVARMVRSGTGSRAVSAGLPALEVDGNVLVAYATKHGATASDGEGDNGPYALALAEHIPTPLLDVRVMFGRVRDTVRRATANQQDPFTYGSIGGDLQYFALAH